MPSLKSSVGSKSTTLHSSNPIRVGNDTFIFHQEGRFTALQSSWTNRIHSSLINRQHLCSPPTSSTDLTGGRPIHTGEVPTNHLTVSTEESRFPSSSFDNHKPSFIAARHLQSVPRNPLNLRGDENSSLVARFGPFKVREALKPAQRGFQKGGFSANRRYPLFPRGEQEVEDREIGIVETKIIGGSIRSPVSQSVQHQFRPQLERIGPGPREKRISGLDPSSTSRVQTCFGPWKVENKFKPPCQVPDSWIQGGYDGKSRAFTWTVASSSSRHPEKSKSVAYNAHDASASRAFQSQLGHNLNDYATPQQPEMRARKKDYEESFSFWNMGRFNRANFVSSASASFDLSLNFTRKRKPKADGIINSSKHRRTRCED